MVLPLFEITVQFDSIKNTPGNHKPPEASLQHKFQSSFSELFLIITFIKLAVNVSTHIPIISIGIVIIPVRINFERFAVLQLFHNGK